MGKLRAMFKKNAKAIMLFAMCATLCGGSVYAAILLSSSEVSYNNNGQATVEGALDELYTLAANKECKDGYYAADGSDGQNYTCELLPPSFATSSWSEIIAGYNAGLTSQLEEDMANGVTRDITLGGDLGTHPVRIANLTPCDEANTVSQSACGLVIEFADIITTHRMNAYFTSETINGPTNGFRDKGGWQYSDMRAYVNNTTYALESIDYSSTGIYSNMPSDLKPLIISTSVVSGHGSNDSSNFTTDDYMYLLSLREVYNYQGGLDTASETDSVTNKAYTRQLDYYNTKGVTTRSNSVAGAIKQNNGSNDRWWLRSTPSSGRTLGFDFVREDGINSYIYSDYTYGVSPAFRLASGIDLTSVSFASSPWSDIVDAYNAGITTQLQADMEAGVTRSITLGGDFGTHPVRIANLTPCSAANTVSQSACGLVIEFADIITTYRMNPYNAGYSTMNGSTNGSGNKGGWEYSDMRAYVNSTTYAFESIDYSSTGIYSNMPSDLKPLIISTSVVSGHGSNDSSNFTTDDYMYLLSRREVWNYQGEYDTASETDSVTNKAYTRQLDYYNTRGVTIDSASAAIKQSNGSDADWWLRSVYSNQNYMFGEVLSYGSYSNSISTNTKGVSPAFRLAE